MNKDDILFIADILIDYDISLIQEEKREYFELMKDKILKIVEQIHIQDTHEKIRARISEIEEKQNHLLESKKN